jgi:hypothetical protein
MGRPTLLTPEMRERVERELSAGAPQRVVARRAGVGERTLRRWIGDGKISRPERPAADADWRAAAKALETLFPERWGTASPADALGQDRVVRRA